MFRFVTLIRPQAYIIRASGYHMRSIYHPFRQERISFSSRRSRDEKRLAAVSVPRAKKPIRCTGISRCARIFLLARVPVSELPERFARECEPMRRRRFAACRRVDSAREKTNKVYGNFALRANILARPCCAGMFPPAYARKCEPMQRCRARHLCRADSGARVTKYRTERLVALRSVFGDPYGNRTHVSSVRG